MKKGRTVLQAKRFGIYSCTRHTSLISAARRMVEDQVSTLVVTDDQGYLEGTITRFEILSAHIALENWASQMVEDHMIRDVITVLPQTLLIDAARWLLDCQARHVVVVLEEDGKRRPIGVLTESDLLYHMVRS